MLFNSLAFAAFFPVVFILYWLCPPKRRWIALLAFSYWFCANLDLRYAVILLATTLLSYGVGRLIDGAGTARGRKTAAAAGIVLLAAELAFFKYTGFILENLSAAASRFSWSVHVPTLQILLPVGISFYIFQTIGYLADVYRGKIKAERHFGYYALFVSFFPSLMSGPIGRAGELLPQYKKPRSFDAAQASYGIKLMAWGYFKKIVIADTLAVTVNQVYDYLESYVGLVLLVAAFLYTIEIYCDFSGYSDIATGMAKLLGIELPRNFDSPYFARSIREFWSRWHISLSSWLRDYIYIPFGGSRCSKARHIVNLMITFLVSGLWHGANWTFLVWGGLHGLYQTLEILPRPSYRKRQESAASAGRIPEKKEPPALLRALQTVLTFVAVTFAWIFFRADTMADAWRVISYSTFGIEDFITYIKTCVISLDMAYLEMVWMMIPVVLLAAADYLSLKKDLILTTSGWKPWVKYPLYFLFVAGILIFAEKGVATEFIYSAF
ncbi:MAG: MBOAT family O-acyltransferase [Eubacteriales bacterium]|nr:MBOAT family O-acyltransferase [Eubacteriales bacterium]